MNTTTFTKDDEVVATHDIPMFGAFVAKGTRGTVVRYYDEYIFATGASWIVDFEGVQFQVRVFEEEIEADGPQVISEEVEETLVIERTDSVGNWGPWSLETDGEEQARENMARDDAIDADAHDFHGVAERHEFRLVKITKTTKRGVL